MEIDEKRKRIALSMKLGDSARDQGNQQERRPGNTKPAKKTPSKPRQQSNNERGSNDGALGALGAALLEARQKRK
jgi:uncharacterized protein